MRLKPLSNSLIGNMIFFLAAKRSLKSAGFSDLFPKLAPLVRLAERGGALECGDPECLMGGRVCSNIGELRASLSHFYTCLVSVAILRPIELKQVTGFGCGLDWDNVVGIATHYEVDDPGFESRWG
jgi:hypothetical protein